VRFVKPTEHGVAANASLIISIPRCKNAGGTNDDSTGRDRLVRLYLLCPDGLRGKPNLDDS
jgi:hypothetical protein